MESKNILTALDNIIEAINNSNGGSSSSGGSNNLITIVFKPTGASNISYVADLYSSSTVRFTQLVNFHKEGLPIVFVFKNDYDDPVNYTFNHDIFLNYHFFENNTEANFSFNSINYMQDDIKDGLLDVEIDKYEIFSDEDTGKIVAKVTEKNVYLSTQKNS